MEKIKVIIADDHSLVRAGIRYLINDIENFETAGEAENGVEAISLVKNIKPDIILLDIGMKELNGLEAAERIKKEYPDTIVVILSMYANEEYVLQALKTGASGYLLKDSAPKELEIALKSVVKGEKYLSPAISRHVIDDYLLRLKGEPEKSKKKENIFEVLTPRQREILQLIAEGNSTKEIADKLHLSFKTVDTHRMQIMKKLNISDVTGLVRYAVRMGLISYDRLL